MRTLLCQTFISPSTVSTGLLYLKIKQLKIKLHMDILKGSEQNITKKVDDIEECCSLDSTLECTYQEFCSLLVS